MGGCGILYDLPWFQFKYKNSAIVVLTHTDINAWWEFICGLNEILLQSMFQKANTYLVRAT